MSEILPSGAAFEHCNHGCAKLQHFHADHIVTGPLNVGSDERKENKLNCKNWQYLV